MTYRFIFLTVFLFSSVDSIAHGEIFKNRSGFSITKKTIFHKPPRGPPGSQGPRGPRGPTGSTIISKGDGVTGATGATGEQGVQGVRGATGTTGSTGATGTTGTSGAQGIQGAQGATGTTGSTGATGAQGIQGIPGTTGRTAPSLFEHLGAYHKSAQNYSISADNSIYVNFDTIDILEGISINPGNQSSFVFTKPGNYYVHVLLKLNSIPSSLLHTLRISLGFEINSCILQPFRSYQINSESSNQKIIKIDSIPTKMRVVLQNESSTAISISITDANISIIKLSDS